MKSSTINVSTGPVQISSKVMAALASAPISHRSQAFRSLYIDTAEYLCDQLKVDKCYLLTGSGTAANEAMLWQIKLRGGKGLILSNGEFGERLINMAARSQMHFIELRLAWGQAFGVTEVEKEIKQHGLSWVLFCHCETSTGVINDLKEITEMCSRHNCLCFVDCMSTIGAHALNLSNVAMATASSGKGLASIPGIAIVCSNIPTISSHLAPAYFDLCKYDEKDGIPYTLSSNLVHALNVAVKLKFQQDQLEMVDFYSQKCFRFFNDRNMLPFDNSTSKVLTIALPDGLERNVIRKMKREQLVMSYESEYLKSKSWVQVALLGYYASDELKFIMNAIGKSFVL